MSQENLDLVRSICAAWERGDYRSAEWAHPQIEFVVEGGVEPGDWTGVAGMAEGWRTWLGAWEEFHQEADKYLVLDDERVLVFFRFSGRGKRVDWSSDRCDRMGRACSTSATAR